MTARNKTPAPWWLYLLACRDGRTYAGVAIDVEMRFRAHQAGKGAKFTRANPPVAILAAAPFATKSEALRAEHALKRLPRAERLEWARQVPERMATKSTQRRNRKGLTTKNTEIT